MKLLTKDTSGLAEPRLLLSVRQDKNRVSLVAENLDNGIWQVLLKFHDSGEVSRVSFCTEHVPFTIDGCGAAGRCYGLLKIS